MSFLTIQDPDPIEHSPLGLRYDDPNLMNLPVAVSWGGGVQSTAIAHLVLSGKLPKPALWLFADTGDEPRAVYRHVEEWGNRITDAGMDFAVVRRKGPSLSAHVLERGRAGLGGISMPPFYVDRVESPGRMPARRGCTRDFKARVLDKEGRARLHVRRGGGLQVVKWIGFSIDEATRMKPSDASWYANVHPLIDLGIRRTDCHRLLAEAGLNAPRSACKYCPHHSDAHWLWMRENEPEEFEQSAVFEDAIRSIWLERGLAGIDTIPSLHPSGEPLRKVRFDQLSLLDGFAGNCAGVCGV